MARRGRGSSLDRVSAGAASSCALLVRLGRDSVSLDGFRAEEEKSRVVYVDDGRLGLFKIHLLSEKLDERRRHAEFDFEARSGDCSILRLRAKATRAIGAPRGCITKRRCRDAASLGRDASHWAGTCYLGRYVYQGDADCRLVLRSNGPACHVASNDGPYGGPLGDSAAGRFCRLHRRLRANIKCSMYVHTVCTWYLVNPHAPSGLVSRHQLS